MVRPRDLGSCTDTSLSDVTWIDWKKKRSSVSLQKPNCTRERDRIQVMWRSLLGRNQTTQYQPDSGPTWQTLGVSNKNKQCSSVLLFHDLFPDLLAHTKLFHTISAVKQKSNYVVGQLRIPVNYIRRCNHNQVIGGLSYSHISFAIATIFV